MYTDARYMYINFMQAFRAVTAPETPVSVSTIVCICSACRNSIGTFINI